MQNKNFFFLFPVGAFIIILFFMNSNSHPYEKDEITVTKRSFDLELLERGELEASKLIHIKSEILSNKAKLSEITKEGTPVKKGEIIAVFDEEPFLEELNKWQQKIYEFQGNLIQAEKELEIHKDKSIEEKLKLSKSIEIAKVNLQNTKNGSGLLELKTLNVKINQEKRNVKFLEDALSDKKRLFEKGFTSKSEVQKAANELLTSKEALKTAIEEKANYEKYTWPKEIKENEIKLMDFKEEAKRKNIQNQYELENKRGQVKKIENILSFFYKEREKEQNNISLCKVKAPIDGVLFHDEIPKNGKRDKIELGDQIWYNQPFMKIPDTQNMIVKTKIREVDVRYIQKGLNVMITLDALPQKKLQGTIGSIESIAQTSLDNKSIKYFNIIINIHDKNPLLRPGMSANIAIKYDTAKNTLAIPQSALQYDETGMYVWKAEGSDLYKQAVVIGKMGSEYAQIVQGLEEGEKVVIK